MKILLPFEVFFRSKNASHFLLSEASVEFILSFDDNTSVTLQAQKATRFSGFELDIVESLIPEDLKKSGPQNLAKKIIAKVHMNFQTGTTFNSEFFKTLEIKQTFISVPTATNTAVNIDYTLTASSWIDVNGTQRITNFGTHPLLSTRELAQSKIYINALVVDLTEMWWKLHKDNSYYNTIFKNLSKTNKVSLRVMANLSGNAFIWYVLIPKYLDSMDAFSPHVFFSPSDNGEHQNKLDEKKYLFDNVDHFQKDGQTLFNYILPPVEDDSIARLKSKVDETWLKEHRNSINFSVAADKKTLSPHHWLIGAGFEKAFYGDGKSKPSQLFFMPQDFGTGGSSTKGIQTLGDPQALKKITDAMSNCLSTNTNLIAASKPDLPKIDKLVLSCYSESGFDLWIASLNNLANIKAIIAIEPQNLNTLTNAYGMKPPIGKDVIPKLLKNNVKVFIVGRHHTGKYKPDRVDPVDLHLLPTVPSKLFAYPPDPNANDFVKYRVERILDLSKDPFALAYELKAISDLKVKKPLLSGNDFLKEVFGPLSNLDCSCKTKGCLCQVDGLDTWYSHNFALTGGEKLTLPAKGGTYGQAISYMTFFQDAVEQVG
jgi:hypothetical protein